MRTEPATRAVGTLLGVEQIERAIERFAGDVALAWYDFRSSEHLFLDADRVLPAASLIKLPILAAALRAVHTGTLDLAKRYAIRIRDRAGGSGVIKTLRRGLHLTVEDLLTLMITVSDNSATNRVIDLVGLDAINAFCRASGWEHTTLIGPLQQPPERQTEAQRAGQRNETSAADMLGVLLQLERGDLLPPTETALARRILLAQEFREGMGRYLPLDERAFEEPLQLASKSGWLPGVRHDAGIVYAADGAALGALVVMTVNAEDRVHHPEQASAVLIGEIAALLIGKDIRDG